MQATDGNLYGTTEGASYGNGTVFRISTAGSFTNLQTLFRSDGLHPIAGLMEASNGNVYGSASSGGTRPEWHDLQRDSVRWTGAGAGPRPDLLAGIATFPRGY